jgi:hypothetical protein
MVTLPPIDVTKTFPPIPVAVILPASDAMLPVSMFPVPAVRRTSAPEPEAPETLPGKPPSAIIEFAVLVVIEVPAVKLMLPAFPPAPMGIFGYPLGKLPPLPPIPPEELIELPAEVSMAAPAVKTIAPPIPALPPFHELAALPPLPPIEVIAPEAITLPAGAETAIKPAWPPFPPKYPEGTVVPAPAEVVRLPTLISPELEERTIKPPFPPVKP